MALTRKFLAALGIEPDKIDEIIDAHSDTVTALKEESEQYKNAAKTLPAVQKELNDLKKSIAESGNDSFEEKYKTLQKEFSDYKLAQETKETNSQKREAYKDLLKEAGVSEKRIGAIIKVLDLSTIELNKDGKIKNSDKLIEDIKSEWSEFITTDGAKGANTATPPKGTDGKMSREDIMKIKDTAERQKAIAENLSQFGY